MRLVICSRTGLAKFANAPVTHFVSLVDPGETAAMEQKPAAAEHHIQLVFSDVDDIEITLERFSRYRPPTRDDVAALIAFGRSLNDHPDWGLLTHCEAGISRSTAAAITILVAAGYRPQTAFGLVRRACREMLPNRRILRFADEFLKTGGVLRRMAEVHRRKAFLRAGYEDPTSVRLREAQEEERSPLRWLHRLLGILPQRLRRKLGVAPGMRKSPSIAITPAADRQILNLSFANDTVPPRTRAD